MSDHPNSEVAWRYHEATKHSYASVRANPHLLDLGNKPLPFNFYSTLEVLRLPREMRHTEIAALAAIAESVPAQTEAVPDLETLAPASVPFCWYHPAQEISGR